jgi:tetratricopeptide (TPR) repeat protein
MGGEPSRAGQYLYILTALLIFLAGCSLFHKVPQAPKEPTIANLPESPVVPESLPEPTVEVEPQEVREQREASEHLQLAQNLLAKGDYEGSLRESRQVLVLVKDQSPADAAMFHMGLVYASPKNPKRDNKQAIGFFNRVIKSYPESPWVEQAKIWVGVLDGVEKLKRVDLDIEEKKRDRLR